jgi:hypothetical protein
MGDDEKVLDEIDELTPEELALLGDSEEETEDLDAEDSEDSEDTATKDDSEDEEETATDDKEETEEKAEETTTENMVPQSRIDEVTRERGETQAKLDLLKTDPDKYYTQYPDEKPAAAPAKHDGHDTDVGSLVVTGGEHDGKTIRDVLVEDPAEGNLLLAKYYDDQRTELADSQTAEAQRIADETAQKK